MQLVEIGNGVEVAVQDGPVVLGGRDQHRRLSAKEQVMRVVRVQGNRLARRRQAHDQARESRACVVLL